MFTPEFYEGVNLTYILSIGIIFLGFYQCYGTNYLIIIGKDKDLMQNTMVVSILGLATAFIFVYFLHAYGAAINVTLVRGFMALGAYYIYTKNKIVNVNQFIM
ncbi:hypothetical protein AYK24_03265 [Thermoplasmatales archaeon SG8-52-4]|nr:MAG: hypothetical protein AYK24_03265 [Thermoplasmatales archaeon SG8-52-4]